MSVDDIVVPTNDDGDTGTKKREKDAQIIRGMSVEEEEKHCWHAPIASPRENVIRESRTRAVRVETLVFALRNEQEREGGSAVQHNRRMDALTG